MSLKYEPSSEPQDMYSNDALTGGHVISIGEGNEEAAIAALKAYPGTSSSLLLSSLELSDTQSL